MVVTKEHLMIVGTYNVAVNATANTFRLKPVDVEIILACYYYDTILRDNATPNIAFRLGKKKENYLYKTMRKLESAGYIFSQQSDSVHSNRGRIAKYYKCSRKGHDLVQEYFIQMEAYGTSKENMSV